MFWKRKKTEPPKVEERKEPRLGMKIHPDVLSRAQRAGQPQEVFFTPYKPPKGAVPEGADLAMDSNGVPTGWAENQFAFYAAEGQTFLGYPYLAQLAQRAEYRIISETIAKEMVRKWIKIKVASDADDKSDKIKAIEGEFKRLKVRQTFRKAAEHDGLYGRGHVVIDYGTDEPAELRSSIGDGWNNTSKNKTAGKPIKCLRVIEPIWTFPAKFGASDPLKDDWYTPEAWYVMGKEIHATRMLTMIGREVADILKPAYAFGGLPMSQMAKPYIDNWLNTRQSVASLLRNFSTSVLKTNMQDVLSGGSDASIITRAQLFAANRDNQGVMLLDKDSEDFANVSAPLSGLHELQAQSQEHIASVSRLPLVKLTGISPSGLNASGETELQVFGDEIRAHQELMFADHIRSILGFVQLGLFGEVDEDITFEFEPLEEMNEKEKAEIRKIEADTDAVNILNGAISGAEARARIANDPSTPYPGLEVEDQPESGEVNFADALEKALEGEDDGDEENRND